MIPPAIDQFICTPIHNFLKKYLKNMEWPLAIFPSEWARLHGLSEALHPIVHHGGRAHWWMTSFCQQPLLLRILCVVEDAQTWAYITFFPLWDIYFYREVVFKLFPWVLIVEWQGECWKQQHLLCRCLHHLPCLVSVKPFLFNFAGEQTFLWWSYRKGHFQNVVEVCGFWRLNSFLRLTFKQYSSFHHIALPWLLQYLTVPGFELPRVLHGFKACTSSVTSSARLYLTFLHTAYIICRSSFCSHIWCFYGLTIS